MSFFPGFEQRRVKVGDIAFNVRIGGSGDPVLLLHGLPQTHVAFHKIAPELARHFTVICADLKGYGDSDAPPPAADSANYSKRVMGEEMLALMRELGHERFALVGHDRGGRVAYRLALDHPRTVTRLGILDIVPTSDYWDTADRHFAVNTFHWGFLARDGGLPERLIGHEPDFFQDYLMRLWAADYAALDPAALAEYRRCFRKPENIAATCADYRAGYGIDDALDRADQKAGKRIACAVLVISGEQYLHTGESKAIEIWRRWAADVRGLGVQCGHFVAEEKPQEVLAALLPFLRES
ncbi:alpha/beta fold hydrolase [Dongia deserti]|uniref:alpha/beta fold hydrolase n=1 Tax=Dongia deserti TaxID=2268030 RepID=UPI000E655ED9|nr:alpha/beta hydrolase [Dongia deserti]